MNKHISVTQRAIVCTQRILLCLIDASTAADTLILIWERHIWSVHDRIPLTHAAPLLIRDAKSGTRRHARPKMHACESLLTLHFSCCIVLIIRIVPRWHNSVEIHCGMCTVHYATGFITTSLWNVHGTLCYRLHYHLTVECARYIMLRASLPLHCGMCTVHYATCFITTVPSSVVITYLYKFIEARHVPYHSTGALFYKIRLSITRHSQSAKYWVPEHCLWRQIIPLQSYTFPWFLPLS